MEPNKYALVLNGIVQSSFFVDASIPFPQVQQMYPDIAQNLIPIPPSILDNYTYNGKIFAAPVPSLPVPDPMSIALSLINQLVQNNVLSAQDAQTISQATNSLAANSQG